MAASASLAGLQPQVCTFECACRICMPSGYNSTTASLHTTHTGSVYPLNSVNSLSFSHSLAASHQQGQPPTTATTLKGRKRQQQNHQAFRQWAAEGDKIAASLVPSHPKECNNCCSSRRSTQHEHGPLKGQRGVKRAIVVNPAKQGGEKPPLHAAAAVAPAA